MKMSDIRKLEDHQLVHEELRLDREIIHARFALKTGQLEDTSKLGKMRRDIARLRTVQRERERERGLTPDFLREKHRATFGVRSSGDRAPEQAEATPEPKSGRSFLKGIVDRVKGSE
jgi:large subunit ribosomal protein L29